MSSSTRLIPYVEIVRRRRAVRCPSSSGSPPAKKRKLTIAVQSEFDSSGDETEGQSDATEVPSSLKSYSRSPSLGAFSRTQEMSLSKMKSKSEELNYPTIVYEPVADELNEDDFLVPGETPPDEDEDEDDSDIPVRVLSEFTIFDEDTLEIIPLGQLLQLDYLDSHYTASGLVKPWVDPDSDDEDRVDDESTIYEAENQLRCSRILEFCIHNLKEGEQCLDGKFYIRTKHAWYILDSPSPTYHMFFSPFWVQHQLLHLLINSSLENPRLTYTEFIENLQSVDELNDCGIMSSSYSILNRGLHEEDLKSDDVMAYILSSLPDVCSENQIKISRVPAIRDLMGSMHYDFDTPTHQSSKKAKKIVPNSVSKFSNKEKEVLKHRNKTFLTPTVNRIAKDFFIGSLEAVPDQEELDDGIQAILPRYKAHHLDPLKIIWGPSFPNKKGFLSANVDGVVYNIGDIVMVAPNPKDNVFLKASQTVNNYGNQWWFCQIRYFFEKVVKGVKTKMFHGIWFHHGSRTLLQETSHSKALYLLESCDDIHVTAIFKKCNFRQLQPGNEEAPDDGSHDSNDFHCRFLYDEEHVAFVNIPDNALDVDRRSDSTCFSCDAKKDYRELITTSKPNPGTVVVYGVSYHVHDFVYIHPSNSSKLLDIGQITKIHDSDQVTISFLGRYDEYVECQRTEGSNSDLVSDERRLFLTENSSVVALHKLDGVCHVLHLSEEKKIEEWIKHDDHYYLNQKGTKKALQAMPKRDFMHCSICHCKDLEIINQINNFFLSNSKLVGMELFSGAGGLGIGMDFSGYVETRYAIEFSPSAAMTYQKNHPNTTVYCQDSSSLLKHAITGLNDKGQPKPLLSKINDHTQCPPLPKKSDQIDFIFGGPPCQSFSRANHSKKQDDIRSSLACNMLSYVEYYEPDYFLLENVAGFLDHKFHISKTTESGEVHHEVKGGMVKFIIRTLIALGYQVQYKLLQAGQYGAPQSRKRVIFWGARQGIPLPNFPVPVFAFPMAANQVTLPTGDGNKLGPPTRSQNPKLCHPLAPLRPRTVDDAIGDLPSFDWKNPHQLIGAQPRDYREAQERQKDHIPQLDAVIYSNFTFDKLPGFPKGAKYSLPPQNRYQQWLRQDISDEVLTGQYTTRMRSQVIEATCNVPLRPLADHRDLPPILLPNHAKPGKSKDRIFYGRMDGKGHFKCAVTTLSPVLKNQWPLHPHQKRLITVREAARSQGFPDSYIFLSNNSKASQIVEDQLRQIGNAVAVPFALALGKELGKAMIRRWEEKGREGSEAL